MRQAPPAPPSAVVERRLHPLSLLVRGGPAWLFVTLLLGGPFAAGFVSTAPNPVAGVVLTALSLLCFLVFVVGSGTAASLLSWHFTRYRIDATEVRIDRGVLRRSSRRIRIDRLQAVDVVRPLFARLFGLTDLKLELAGGQGSDGHLAYLAHDEALRIRQVLLQQAATLQRTAASAPQVEEEAAPIASVSRRMLVGSLLRSGLGLMVLVDLVALVVLLIGVAVAVPLGLDERVAVALLLAVGAAGAVVPLVAVAAGWGQFAARHGFRLSDTPQGLRIEHGLFRTVVQTVPLERVQGVAVVEPLLWRRRGWARLDVDVAGYVGAETGQQRQVAATTLLPVGDPAMADAVLRRVLPGGWQGVRSEPAGRSARWLRPIGWRHLGCGADDRHFVATSGWLVRRTMVVPHAKTQSVRVIQGPLQRPLGLAHVAVDTPPGPVTALARHRPASRARAIAEAQRWRAERARAVAAGVAGSARP